MTFVILPAILALLLPTYSITAESDLDVAAAWGQISAEVAIAVVTTALLRPAFSVLRLGLAVSDQIWKWEALTKLSGVAAGLTAGRSLLNEYGCEIDE